ncbi:hypothetical protein ILUMI_19370 [Ignelater luminosus]|uniref:Uncharacterized protein n=1 Tax=Ignelater luminosus TaxID=2038154 RepID=A0A8K0CKB9_IGNLU|nr:hypothetical protein ILUMI_19370 [Ignelater luminosus]
MNYFNNLLFSLVIFLPYQMASNSYLDLQHPHTIQEKYLVRQIEFDSIYRAAIANTTHELLPYLDVVGENNVTLLNHYRNLLIKLASAKKRLEKELKNFYNKYNFDRWKVVDNILADVEYDF